MAAFVRSHRLAVKLLPACRSVMVGMRQNSSGESNLEAVTHTGQQFSEDDYRRVRFVDKGKLVTQNFAIDMVAEEPVVVCSERVVYSDGGGPLGHPRVYINLDPPGEHVCGYSGRRFVHKKYYNEGEMGPSITYEQYLEEVKTEEKDYPQ